MTKDNLPIKNQGTSCSEGKRDPVSSDKTLQGKTAAIRKLEDDLKAKDQSIHLLKVENLRLKAELEQIKASLTWKLLMNFHNGVIEIFLSRGTRRRAWYDRTREALQKLTQKSGRRPVATRRQYHLDIDKHELEAQKKTQFPFEPKISIIVPTYNTRTDFLVAMIESVKNQSYGNWELCIADGGSKEPQLKSVLEKYAAGDTRIKIKFLNENKGISGNSNAALSLATGDYFALLDHDDTLTPSALFEVVKAINENPRAGFIYSDFAGTDEHNTIHHMALCPDFCRYYYLSHPYIVHLVVIKKEIMDKVAGFDEVEFNSGVSQDVDLFLRIFALLDDKEIHHIPKILYLWKLYGKSAGHRFQNKVHKYTKKALTRYLTSKQIDGTVEDGLCFNTFRVRCTIQNNPLVSIIIPTKDKWQLLSKCIKSIEAKSGYRNYEIIILSNNTEDEEAAHYLQTLTGRYRVEKYNKPFNYSAINNWGAELAKGDFLLFLNDDIEFKSKNALEAVLEPLQLPDVGAVGAKLLYHDNTIQHAGVIIGFHGAAEHWHKFMHANINNSVPEPGYLSSLVSIREYSAVTGAFLMTKKSIFTAVGGFSEDLSVGFNDIDFCLKLIAGGHRILCTPYALAYHYESASRRDPLNTDLLDHPEDRKIFLEKWAATIEAGDPCFNPNLDTFSYIPVPRDLKRNV
jgi:O-antigen biosynthesis protein